MLLFYIFIRKNQNFYTVLIYNPSYRKKQDEESITVHEVAPASSVPCPPPTKTLRRKLGDFFTLKKRRALKSETSQEGRPKKASIADFIRPLREVGRADKEKDKDRVKEHDKENEKEKAKEHPSGVTGEAAVQETPVSGVPPLRGEAGPPRRALREGKSQSLILLSGAAGTTNARNTAKVSAIRDVKLRAIAAVLIHPSAVADFRNNLKANIALNRNFISCFNVLEFPNRRQERHRCVDVWI